MDEAVQVLFVCLGNICRSPTAEAVFCHHLERHGLSGRVQVDSCGTGGWHVGCAPDERACAAARRRGYAMEHLRARQFCAEDFGRHDYILAMDRMNLEELQRQCSPDYPGRLALFLSYTGQRGIEEVPDPYYGDGDGFDHVLDLIESASEGLLRDIRRAHALE